MAVATERTTQQLMADESSEVVPRSTSVDRGTAGRVHRPRWVVPVAVALAFVLVGALVATVWFGIQTVNGFIAERGHSGALEAGKEVATNFTTFDVGTAEADTKRLVSGFTPDYAAAFAQDGDTIMKSLHQGQVRSTGTVTEAGLLSYDGPTSTAHVLVTVRAQLSSTAAPGGQPREYRMDLTMIDKGQWLADSVEFVG